MTADDGVTNGVLWVTKGNPADMIKVLDQTSSGLTVLNNKVYFNSNDGVNGVELWVTDATVAGTQMLKDINPGASGSNPNNFIVSGNVMYFSASDGVTSNELYKMVPPWP